MDLADDDDDTADPVAAADGDLGGVQSRSRTSVLLCVVKLNSVGLRIGGRSEIIGVCSEYRGDQLYDLWFNREKSYPIIMNTASVNKNWSML